MKPTITITLNRSTFFIGILSVTAMLMLLAVLIKPAKADFAVKERDYQMVDVVANIGGDVVYVIDNKTGNALLFNYDPNRRSIEPLRGVAMPNLFKP